MSFLNIMEKCHFHAPENISSVLVQFARCGMSIRYFAKAAETAINDDSPCSGHDPHSHKSAQEIHVQRLESSAFKDKRRNKM